MLFPWISGYRPKYVLFYDQAVVAIDAMEPKGNAAFGESRWHSSVHRFFGGNLLKFWVSFWFSLKTKRGGLKKRHAQLPLGIGE